MITHIDAEQLTAMALSWTETYSGTSEDPTALDIAAFIAPVVAAKPTADAIHKLLDAGRSYWQAIEMQMDPMEIMDEKGGSWARHAQKSLRRVQVIAEAIADGGRP